ncbi:MAG: hypothetical protein ACLSA6_05275 [Holdemania massiliensis]
MRFVRCFQLGYPDRPAIRIQLRLEAETPRFSVLLLDLDLPSALKLPNAGVSAPQPSFTMLEVAIDQETVGVYWEENLPLFYISSSLLKALNFTYDEFYLQCQGQLDLLLYPDDVGPAKAQARQALQQANQFELTLRLTRRDRSVLWRQCRGFRFLTDQGRIAVLIFFSDIQAAMLRQSELQSELNTLQQRNAEMAMLTDHLPGGICLVQVDDALTLLYANLRFYGILQRSADQIRSTFHNELSG